MMKNKINLFVDKFLKTEDIRSVYFTPHSQIGLRSADGRLELLGDTLTPTGSTSFFTSFVGEENYSKLLINGSSVSEIKLDSILIVVDALLTDSGVTFSLTKKEVLKTNIDDYPQMITNFLNMNSGLVIGVHKKSSEINRIEREIFSLKLGQKTQSAVYVRTDKELPFFHKDAFVINVLNKNKSNLEKNIQEIDLIRYGLIENAKDIDNINLYLSSGIFVLAHIHANKVSEALVYLQAQLKTWESRYLMSQSLVGFYSFLNWKHENKLNYAFEAYPFGPITKNKFYSLDSKDYFSFFENDFKTNGLSFSQSLHTKVLKRSIDLRKAFELTPDPSDLDYILKKSGL